MSKAGGIQTVAIRGCYSELELNEINQARREGAERIIKLVNERLIAVDVGSLNDRDLEVIWEAFEKEDSK